MTRAQRESLWIPRTRSVAIDRLEAVARSEEAELSRGAGSASAAGPGGSRGWTGADNGGGNRPIKSAVISRLEQRLEMRERVSARDGAEKVAPELTANIRRKIQFLQDCDWWVMFLLLEVLHLYVGTCWCHGLDRTS